MPEAHERPAGLPGRNPGRPRVLSIAIHPQVMGAPHRIGRLRKMIGELRPLDNVAFKTGGEIADWYRSRQ